MTIAPRKLGWLAVVSLAVLSACAPQANAPTDGAAAAGGELTCAEREKAQGICLRAMGERCAAQQNDCDATCDSRNQMTGDTRKHPSNREELDAPRCRDACRVNRDACLRSVLTQCPTPCTGESAAPAPAPSAPSDTHL
jgi:hypothetical protein